MKAALLSDQQIGLLKDKLPNWSIREKKLIRELSFPNFINAFGFITKVAMIAETMNHHPEWSNCYSKVNIELSTHELGGISNLDIELARNIDKLIEE